MQPGVRVLVVLLALVAFLRHRDLLVAACAAAFLAV
jgi:hypothetical protein